ncbi:MAG: GNAT family N-acetyltransferase [Gemmatimonadetes bacterium]|nr:GNAT family N-acetyltransferase [Gemmatimonadota bacterium]
MRPAGAADVGGLVERNLALAAESEDRVLDRSAVEAGVRAILGSSRRGRYWVAEVDGTVRGQCLVTEEPSDWTGGRYWWIQSVYIDPDWRGTGVFRRLWEVVGAAAAEAGDVASIRLYVARGNRAARAVYERLGMEETDYRVYEKPVGELG